MVNSDQMACNGMSSSFSFFPSNFHAQQLQSQNEIEDHQQFTHNSSFFSLPANPQDIKGVEDDDYSDDCSRGGEKKMRLNIEQVRILEKNFEIGNKLEPERKMQLARAIGLQPRQVAIWFQNRRARCKTKQLEKDYDVLKRQFEATKSENEALLAQNKKLQAEIMALKGRDTSELINLNTIQTDSCSSEINLDISRTSTIDSSLNHQQNIPFFTSIRPLSNTMVQVPDENFNNYLCNIDDQSTWSW